MRLEWVKQGCTDDLLTNWLIKPSDVTIGSEVGQNG